MRDVRALWADAAQLYDAPASGLQAASHTARWSGFAGGTDWMRRAMGVVRGRAPTVGIHPVWLGARKYALASLAALLVLALLGRLPVLAGAATVVTFYAVEARLVFAFPLALDGEPAPLLASHRLVTRTMPPAVATARVMHIAARMLLGGFAGGGFVRSWCLGCLAVVLWYEDARRTVEVRA